MCTYIYTCIYIYIHIHIYIYVNMSQAFVKKALNLAISHHEDRLTTSTYMSYIYVCVHVYIYTYLYTYMYIYTYTYIRICIYIFAHTSQAFVKKALNQAISHCEESLADYDAAILEGPAADLGQVIQYIYICKYIHINICI